MDEDLRALLAYYGHRIECLRGENAHELALCTANGIEDVCGELRKILEGKESYTKGWTVDG